MGESRHTSEEIVDDIMMRIVEVLLSIPYLIIVILISVVTDSKKFFGTLMLALTLTGWCGIARLGPWTDASVKITGICSCSKCTRGFAN